VVALSDKPDENKVIKKRWDADVLEALSRNDAVNYGEYLRLD